MASQYSTFDRAFAGARATFQRLSDAKILHGWIEKTDGYTLVVRTDSKADLKSGDLFSFRLSGRVGDANFNGRLTRIECDAPILVGDEPSQTVSTIVSVERHCSFIVEGSVQIGQSETEARYWREEGSVCLDGWLQCSIKDVSLNGLGLVSQEPIPSKSTVSALISDGAGQIEAQAEVRYCRKIYGDSPHYRIGLKLLGLDRLNTSRWAAMLDRAA